MSDEPVLATLAKFQQEAMEALAGSIRAAEEYIVRDPEHRAEIARSAGVMLLESPTGSGKTLTLGRTLEAVRGRLSERCVWFWFAPYAGLVTQTREALAEQCPTLRLRELASDRNIASLRDGDVFVQTWASVAKRNKESLRVRRRTESALSLDEMLAQLRVDGVHVGVVIDEAHLNFGVNAKAAALFYLETLRPDFTLLATATPNDEKLIDFERAAGVKVESRVTVDRGEVVRAALNKRGLKVGVLRFREADAKFIEPEMAALAAGWDQHTRIKARLNERGIVLAPLMLVQVEDKAASGPDPVARVRDKLVELGVPSSAIAVHTSGQPDPEFHTLAYDDSREVLVFKVSVATGFDAPRAWTLVSVRPNRGKAFGLQIVGRIMRVHPALRPLHGNDDLLDRGYVFLTDETLQAGLDAAAAELKAVRSSIEAIADELTVQEFSNTDHLLPDLPHSALRIAQPPRSPAEREHRLFRLEQEGIIDGAAVRARSLEEQDRAIVQGEFRRSLTSTPLFGELAESAAPSRPFASAHPRSFRLRTERGVPGSLRREVLPTPDQWNQDVLAAAGRALFRPDETPLKFLRRSRGQVSVNLRDVFLGGDIEQRDLSVRMSNARIAEAAQASFAFNENIDPRHLKKALLDEFKRRCEHEGYEYEDADLRRALDLFAMNRPDAMRDALREAQAEYVQVANSEPLTPLVIDDDTPLRPSKLGAYEVFPTNMNNEERQFAEWLDEDPTGHVKWWLRLQESAKWAVSIILPTGRRFFPDFAVGIAGRPSRDHIALVEIKDDGSTGRLHSDDNRIKIRAAHREYKNVSWTVREGNVWANAKLDPDLDRILPRGRLDVDLLRQAN